MIKFQNGDHLQYTAESATNEYEYENESNYDDNHGNYDSTPTNPSALGDASARGTRQCQYKKLPFSGPSQCKKTWLRKGYAAATVGYKGGSR